jgi:tRNA (cytidine32/guanosine34-2'-O)-methyltransferase
MTGQKNILGCIISLFILIGCNSNPRSKAPPDPFYRKAKQQGYRARSAYKLLEIDEEFNIFWNVSTAVDLCAAPGSWSQVIKSRLIADARIVAVDLQHMSPIQGVHQLTGDITRPETIRAIRDALCPAGTSSVGSSTCDLVVCDGAPDLSGLRELDAHLAHALSIAALRAAAALLTPGGTFVLKIFVACPPPPPLPPDWPAAAAAAARAGRGSGPPFAGASALLHAQLCAAFDAVTLCKPRSSRATSREHFAVCRGFRPPSPPRPRLARPPACDGRDPPLAPAEPPQAAAAAAGEVPALWDEVLVPLLALGTAEELCRPGSLDSDSGPTGRSAAGPSESPGAGSLRVADSGGTTWT